MKKFNLVGVFVFMLGFCLAISTDSYAQKKKKKGKPAPVASATPVQAAPTKPEEPKVERGRRLPIDSIDYHPNGLYNPMSVQSIRRTDVMYKMKVWRQVDLREKCNQGFFFRDQELTKFLLEAVRKNQLTPFSNDSCIETVPLKKFEESLTEVVDPNNRDLDNIFKAKSLYFLELREDLIFDKNRSITVPDIQTIKIYVPGKETQRGYNQDVATFRYKDVERVLNNYPLARWKNGYNNIEDKRFSDAFRLRLFCSRIIKIHKDNSADLMISDLDQVKAGGVRAELEMSRQYEYELVNTESELYEY